MLEDELYNIVHRGQGDGAIKKVLSVDRMLKKLGWL